MQRSAISVISLSTATGCDTRVSSPASAIAATNAWRVSSAIMDGADAAGQQVVADVMEARGGDARGERGRIGKREHGLWQVGIGVRMFRHRAPDRRQDPAEIEEVRGAQ